MDNTWLAVLSIVIFQVIKITVTQPLKCTNGLVGCKSRNTPNVHLSDTCNICNKQETKKYNE